MPELDDFPEVALSDSRWVAGLGHRADGRFASRFCRDEWLATSLEMDRVFLASGGGMDRSYADVIQNDDGSVRFLRIGGRLGYPVASSP